ncbi:MAG: S8 family serine peptidase [bacterium]
MTAVTGIIAPYLEDGVRPLFSRFTHEKLADDREALQRACGHELADLSNYYRLDITDPTEAETVINALNQSDDVELAYFAPIPEVAGDIDPPTPDYEASQDYLEPAPDGVDAAYAHTQPGGNGAGVKIVDIEINWQTTHEDLEAALGGVIGSYPGASATSDHGTAVLGEMVSGDNGYGVTGICPAAEVGMVSVFSISTAQAIYTAIDNLEAGDLILIELHSPGPRYNYQSRPDQLGYVCMEFWQANFDAIQYAWAKGIVVVEAAGNGAEDFDDVLYGSLFDTTYRNSHAIIVGAGYPPASGSDRQRLGFSNYGQRVDLQGYGSGVYTTGYGSLFNGDGDLDQYYTATFSGTSSASPIVTGAAACLQGNFKATYGTVMTSDQVRDALVTTGSPQQGSVWEHIGPRPDLQQAMTQLSPPTSLYAIPILIETSLETGTSTAVDLWLYNRSASETLDFTATDVDTFDGNTADWLSLMPLSGLILPLDSTLVSVGLDASTIPDQIGWYRAMIDIEWGLSGSPLDSLLEVPVYLTVPCFDTTYSATSSQDLEGPSFQWISARQLGTKLDFDDFYHGGAVNPLDDGSIGPRNIGFKFPYYDTLYNRIFVGVNGGVSFTDTNLNVNGFFSGIDIPGAPFSTIIAPLWSDLIFDTVAVPGGGIYWYNDPAYDTLVIEWYHVGSFNGIDDTAINFELILTVDGSILFQYADLGTGGLETTAQVGIGEVACAGLSYVNNGDPAEHIVNSGETIRLYYTARRWVRSGDVNASGGLDIADLVYLVQYMFGSGPEPIPLASANINCIGDIDISDLVHLVNYMFNGGPEPCYFLMDL